MNLIERAIAALSGSDPRVLLEAELSHGDVNRALQAKVKESKPAGVYCYIAEVYDDWFVYTEEGNGSYKSWAQKFSLAAGGAVTLVDLPWEVKQHVEWLTVAEAAFNAEAAKRRLVEASKASVNYRQAAEGSAATCGGCAHYSGGKCDIVAGSISPAWTCDRFAAATTEAEAPQPAGTEVLIEAAIPLLEKSLRKDRSFPVKLITPGWGTSGYYSKAMLKKAAEAGRFPSGVKMFWNHPTSKEAEERPERNLHDLAAKTTSAGVYKENGADGPGVYAEAKAYSNYAPHIEEMAEDIGVSIRGFGVTSPGEAEGQKGALVEDIAVVQSVDFVTQAGRGGKVLQLFEAARATASAAVEPPKQEDTPVGDAVPQLQESAALIEGKDKEIAAEKQRSRRAMEALVLREASDVVRDALSESKLPDITKKRLSEQLSLNPPTVEADGEVKLDSDKFKGQIKDVLAAEATYIAALTGQGNVATLGEGDSGGTGGAAPSVDDSQKALVEAFKSIGLDDKTATAAASGRAS